LSPLKNSVILRPCAVATIPVVKTPLRSAGVSRVERQDSGRRVVVEEHLALRRLPDQFRIHWFERDRSFRHHVPLRGYR
jgi:hypothetical protein